MSMIVRLVGLFVLAEGRASFENLLTLDCGGGLHVGSGTFAEVNANVGKIIAAIDKTAEVMESHAKCMCPDITDKQIREFVTPDLAMLFRRMDQTDEEVSRVLQCE
jgi:hypothetical protein